MSEYYLLKIVGLKSQLEAKETALLRMQANLSVQRDEIEARDKELEAGKFLLVGERNTVREISGMLVNESQKLIQSRKDNVLLLEVVKSLHEKVQRNPEMWDTDGICIMLDEALAKLDELG